jgi:DNA-binding MarR family transcriptional regulator
LSGREETPQLRLDGGWDEDRSPVKKLDLWRRVLAASVGGALPDLSQRQMAILLTVYLTKEPHTVRGLAKGLKISKPAVTRALTALGKLGLIKRLKDKEDKRNVLVSRTVKGATFLSEFGTLITVCETKK